MQSPCFLFPLFLFPAGSFTLNPIYCGLPGIPGVYEGEWSLGTVFKIGSNASYSCPDSLTLVGPALRTCQEDGTWTGRVPECVSKILDRVLDMCRDMTSFEIKFPAGMFPRKLILHGLEKITMGFPHDHVFREFELNTTNTNFVNQTLETPLKVCSYQIYGWTGGVVQCGVPEVPANAIYRIDSSGKIVTYTCAEGFVLLGAKQRICTDSNMWGKKQARCVQTPTTGPFMNLLRGTNLKNEYWEGAILLFLGFLNTFLWFVVIALLIIKRRDYSTNFQIRLGLNHVTSASSTDRLCLNIEPIDVQESPTLNYNHSWKLNREAYQEDAL